VDVFLIDTFDLHNQVLARDSLCALVLVDLARKRKERNVRTKYYKRESL
jgi:hypothetical protein